MPRVRGGSPVGGWRVRHASRRATLAGSGVLAAALTLGTIAGRRARHLAEGQHLDLVDATSIICRHMLPFAARDGAAGDARGVRAMRDLAAGADVIALGESTHGTAEFSEVKSRIIRMLIRDGGVRTVAFEAPWERARRVDRFLATGEGTADEVVRELALWPWNTDDVVALVQWMRDWNIAHPSGSRLRFTGFDPQLSEVDGVPEDPGWMLDTTTRRRQVRVRAQSAWVRRSRIPPLQRYLRDRYMAENLADIAAQRTEHAPVVAWAHNGHVATAWPFMGGFLAKASGLRYRAVALLAGSGDYAVMVRGRNGRYELGTARMAAPSPRGIEGLLGRCGAGPFLLPTSGAGTDRAIDTLLQARLMMRSIGALAPSDSSAEFHATAAGKSFDMLWFTGSSTRSRTRGTGGRAPRAAVSRQ